ncbi:MAG: hypothetical protein SNJ81_19900 [Cyanobacteriota bacterium]
MEPRSPAERFLGFAGLGSKAVSKMARGIAQLRSLSRVGFWVGRFRNADCTLIDFLQRLYAYILLAARGEVNGDGLFLHGSSGGHTNQSGFV